MRKTWTDEQLIEAVKTASKMMDVSKTLGLKNLGRNYTTLKKHIERLNLDISHFLSKQELIAKARENISILTNEELFSKNSID